MTPYAPRVMVSFPAILSWVLAGNFIYAGCQWSILIIFAHWGTPALVGHYVLALAVSVPIMSLFTLQIRNIQATDVNWEYQFGDYLALRLITLTLAVAVTWVISVIMLERGDALRMVIAVSLMACADGLSDTAYGLLQQREQQERIAHSKILRGLLSAAGVGLVMSVTRRPDWAILTGAVARIIVFLSVDLSNVRFVLHDQPGSIRPCWNVRALSSLAVMAAPLGVVTMLLVLNNQLPRYFVARELGPSALGIFGAIGYVPAVGTMVVVAICETITPRLSRDFSRENKTTFVRLWVSLTGFGLAMGAAGILISMIAGPQILSILYGADYASHSDLLLWMMAAATLGYAALFSGCALTAARFFRSQLPLFLVVVATNAVACYWLVPPLGLKGAALALLVSSFVQFLGATGILGCGIITDTATSILPPAEGEDASESM